MKAAAERVGRGACPNCGEPVTFKRSKGGLLNFKCDADNCYTSGYADQGTTHDKWMATIKAPAGAAPAAGAPAAGAPARPAPIKPAPTATPASTGFGRNSAFSLGQL